MAPHQGVVVVFFFGGCEMIVSFIVLFHFEFVLNHFFVNQCLCHYLYCSSEGKFSAVEICWQWWQEILIPSDNICAKRTNLFCPAITQTEHVHPNRTGGGYKKCDSGIYTTKCVLVRSTASSEGGFPPLKSTGLKALCSVSCFIVVLVLA